MTANFAHVLLLGGISQSLVNFRGPLIKALLAAGHRVTAAAGDDDPDVVATLKRWGASFEHVQLARTSVNPLADIVTLAKLTALMRALRPDVFFGYTIKPVIYGLMAARVAGVPRRLAMITGLGYAFTEGRGLKRNATQLAALAAYRLSLRSADRVVFQNPDDETFFLQNHLLRSNEQAARVNGSGVDLEYFAPAPTPAGPITFLMIARLLRDKGVAEFVEAARIIRQKHPECRFVLVGPFDPNPSSVGVSEVEAWVRQGFVEYRGALRDVRPSIASCHVYVLPSYYREGVPRTILEAMAMSRPIITTDMPGCRETVEDGRNGFLVAARDPAALALAMERFIDNPLSIRQMGFESRAVATAKFGADDVASSLARLALNGPIRPNDCVRN